jgi:DNA end-binding protein Ku
MRAIWSGALSFGLVNIPVKLYSAAEDRDLHFHLLHKEDMSPIRYARVCRHEGKEIPYEDIVRGYEYAKGDYVVLADEDFDKADLRKTKAIDIAQFADGSEIDSKYFDTPYYLEPAKGAEKPYSLLREALKRTGKVGLGKFVLRQKEILCVIRPENDLLVLERIRFYDQIREPDGLKIPAAVDLPEREIDLALELIDHLSATFEPEKFKDTYTEELKEVIEQKAQGKEIEVRGEAPAPTRVKDLMSVLRQSLEREKEKSKT